MTGAVAQSWILGAVGVVSLVVGAERVVAYRQRPETARAYLAVSQSTIGLALVLNVTVIGRVVDLHLLDVANVSLLISQVLVAIGAWAAVEMVAASAGRPCLLPRAARAGGVVVSCGALVAAFSHAGLRKEAPVVQLFTDTAQVGEARPYWLVFGVIAVVPGALIAMLSARHAGEAETWLRVGLYLVAAGAVLTATFGIFIIVSLWLTAAAWIAVLQMAVVALGALCIGVGCAVPHLPEVRSRRAVHPVWSALTALYPEVRAGRRPDVRRLVTEVQDCVVVARHRDELASPMIRAVADLPARPADRFDESLADLVVVGRRRLSAVWDDEPLDVVPFAGDGR